MKATQVPFSKEVEISLISSMMCDVDAMNQCCERLQPDDFHCLPHMVIFSAIRCLYKTDIECDLNSLHHQLKQNGDLEKSGGVNYLVELKHLFDKYIHIEHNIKILKEQSILRKLMKLAKCLHDKAAASPPKASDLVEEFEQELFQLGRPNIQNTSYTLAEILEGKTDPEGKSFLQRVQEKQEQYRKGMKVYEGFPTHFKDLDDALSGFTKGRFIIIGARPGVGKTSFMLNLAINIGKFNKVPIGIFSLEMPGEEITKKMIYTQAERNGKEIDKGNLNGTTFQELYAAAQELDKIVMLIDDQPSLTISQLRARARRMKEINGVQIIFIDYIQLMKAGNDFESKQYEVTEISQQLKNLAKDLKIPVIGLAQLNREIEKRHSKEPMLSDLRESGSLEQDSDAVLLLHRPDMYDETNKPGLIEIFIAKNRFGECKKVTMYFDKASGKLKDYNPFADKNEKEEEENEKLKTLFRTR